LTTARETETTTMRPRVGLALTVGVAAAVIAAGAALALSDTNSSVQGSQGGAALAKGVTRSGESYTISNLRQDDLAKLGGGAGMRVSNGLTCVEVQANGMGGGGCLAAPEAGKSIAATQTTLGDDMIVQVLANASVDAVEVRRVDGQGDTAIAKEPVDLDALRLYHTVLHTPPYTLPTGKDGIPSSPVVEINALDSDGKVIDTQTLDPSGPGGTH
jgi:hypothetical protein